MELIEEEEGTTSFFYICFSFYRWELMPSLIIRKSEIIIQIRFVD